MYIFFSIIVIVSHNFLFSHSVRTSFCARLAISRFHSSPVYLRDRSALWNDHQNLGVGQETRRRETHFPPRDLARLSALVERLRTFEISRHHRKNYWYRWTGDVSKPCSPPSLSLSPAPPLFFGKEIFSAENILSKS